jgi:hypothetical protein
VLDGVGCGRGVEGGGLVGQKRKRTNMSAFAAAAAAAAVVIIIVMVGNLFLWLIHVYICWFFLGKVICFYVSCISI